MSELYNKRIKQAYENAKGSMEIEGFRFTESDEKLITAYLKKKEITKETFIKIARERCARKHGK
jgi:hypothetical protein